MFRRELWIRQIEAAWEKRLLVWLSGARRAGKTTLSKMLNHQVFLNCDLPTTARKLSDPELFFSQHKPKTRIIFDEVHRLEQPSLLLKILADEYPHLQVLATGSSTLAATRKFRDSLTGRKIPLYLPPVLWEESLMNFGVRDLDRRLLHGGMPEALLDEQPDPVFYSEWIDSYYARDIQELFSVRQRSGFLKLLRLLLRQSGGLLDYGQAAKLCGLSRPTVMAHLEALYIAHAAFPLPPFHGAGRSEITKRPKVYGFDTGFVCYSRGVDSLRDEDRGNLWEHLVLDTLRSRFPDSALRYWRDKSGNELDFVFVKGRQKVHAIECKINPDALDGKTFRIFRGLYPHGKNILVSPAVGETYGRRVGEQEVLFCSLQALPSILTGADPSPGP